MAVDQPEYWRSDAVDDRVTVLDIPDVLGRSRVFDVDVTLLVRVPAESPDPWHELRVDLDGRRQWSRRIASSNPGQTDGLDYHCRISLEAGRTLRVQAAAAAGKGIAIEQLFIEAREEGA